MITRVRYQLKPLTGLIRISKFNSVGKPAEYTLQLFHEIRGILPIRQDTFRTHTEAIAFASTVGFLPYLWNAESTN